MKIRVYSVSYQRAIGKSYSVKNYFARNKQIAKASDIIIGMIPEGVTSNGTQSTLDYGKKFGKKTIIMS